MTFEHILTILVTFLYFLATLASFLGALSMRRPVRIVANWLTLAGFCVNTLLIISTFMLHSLEELSAAYYLLFLSWCILLLYLAAWSFFKFSFITLTAAPLALILSVLSTRYAGIPLYLPEHLGILFFGLHISSLFISLGLLALASGTGVLFLYVMHKLKKKAPLGEFIRDQPALTTFDKVNHFAVIIGFPLYSLGLLSGYIWATMPRSNVIPKTAFSMVIWFLYALLFYQRMALGLRGKKTALLAILIFVLWSISLIIDFSMPIHHSQILSTFK